MGSKTHPKFSSRVIESWDRSGSRVTIIPNCSMKIFE